MRFGEKLKFFVFGGCFVALGVVLTYFSDIRADANLVGEVKQFDTIVCKNLSIEDNNGKTRVLISCARKSPMFTMYNKEGQVTFVVSGEPATLLVGKVSGNHIMIRDDSVVNAINGKGVFQWP